MADPGSHWDQLEGASPDVVVALQQGRGDGRYSERSLRHPGFPQGWTRVGVAAAIPGLLRDWRIDPHRLFAQSGLEIADFADPDSLVPLERLGRLFGLCREATRCEHFGLLVGRGAAPSGWGAVGCLALHAPTVGDALGGLVRHFHHHDRGVVLSLQFEGDVAMFGHAAFLPAGPAAEQLSDSAMATAFNLLRAIGGPDWRPSEILLERRAPADPNPFRQFFGSAIRFNQEAAAILFPAHWLARPISGADPVMRRILERRIAEMEAQAPQSLSDRLRARLRSILMREKCSIDDIAHHLDLHPRALRRRLLQENTTYSALVDEVRFEIARRLLAVSSLTAGEIASALDYGDSAAFTRAFKRWSGVTPSAWRLAEGAR